MSNSAVFYIGIAALVILIVVQRVWAKRRDAKTHAMIDSFAQAIVGVGADYSMVEDPTGKVCGVWLRDPKAFLKNPNALEALAVTKDLGYDTFELIASKKYRIVPNDYDSKGGSFVMFGSARAPGERQ